MSTHRRAWAAAITLTVSVLAGAGLLAGCGASNEPAASPAATQVTTQPVATTVALSAPALLKAALAGLRAGSTVRVDITTASPKSGPLVVSTDAAATSGRQVITWDKTATETVLLIGRTGYVQANAQALTVYMGVPQAQAGEYAGKWISLQPGEKLGLVSYGDITAGLTLSSVASGDIVMDGPLTLVKPATEDGQRTAGVSAHVAKSSGLPSTARNVLYATEGTTVRPVVLETVNAGPGNSYRMTFSHWGEKLHLTAPAGATPVSAITSQSSIT